MDPNGMVNEIFKAGCIGSDPKEALLLLFEGTKTEQIIPMFMNLCNITSIHKGKGSKFDLENDRGIFILTVLKKILDKLIYFDKYEELDANMSDSNIGARKNRNARDHLLIIHGIINSVIRGGEECIDIQIYDIQKAFDALWLEDSLNDIKGVEKKTWCFEFHNFGLIFLKKQKDIHFYFQGFKKNIGLAIIQDFTAH